MNYISLTELKVTSELIGFSFADYDAEQAISAASRGIEEYTGRFFTAAGTTYATRYYTPSWGGYIGIDDITTVGTVTTDWDGDGVFETTWTANRDYLLEPFNAALDGKPYEEIRVHPMSSLRLPCWPRSVAVTGTFGWPSVPPQVKEITTLMAARLIKRKREAPFGVAGIGIDGTPIRIARVDPELQWLIDPLKKGGGVLAA